MAWTHTIFDEIDTFDWAAFQENSFRLEAFRVCDFDTAMKGELVKVISRSAGVHLRYLALVDRVCSDKANQYVKRPSRTFGGSQARAGKLEDTYKRSKVDRFMLTAAQKAVGQNSVVIAADPTRNPRRVRLHSFIPGEVCVESKDLMITDIRDADRVTLRVPLKQFSQTGNQMVVFGRRVYTPTEAYVEAPGGKRKGLFNPLDPDDITNPFGEIPLVAVRLTEAPKGWFLPRLPKDMLSVQIGLIIGMADIENICRLKCAGREIVTGSGANFHVQNMSAGPEGFIGLPGNDLDYEYAAIDPSIDKYLLAIETTLKHFAHYKYVTGALSTSTGITGDAKEVERAEQLEDRIRMEGLWADAEQELVELVARTAMLGPSAVDLPRPQVQVDFHYAKPRRNDLQTEQARFLRLAMGLDAAVDDYADEHQVPKAVAVERVESNLKAYGELLQKWKDTSGMVVPPPGLDAIATQVIRQSQPGRPAAQPPAA